MHADVFEKEKEEQTFSSTRTSPLFHATVKVVRFLLTASNVASALVTFASVCCRRTSASITAPVAFSCAASACRQAPTGLLSTTAGVGGSNVPGKRSHCCAWLREPTLETCACACRRAAPLVTCALRRSSMYCSALLLSVGTLCAYVCVWSIQGEPHGGNHGDRLQGCYQAVSAPARCLAWKRCLRCCLPCHRRLPLCCWSLQRHTPRSESATQ